MFKKLALYFLFISLAGHAQNTPNIGFEDGTFNKWHCLSGIIDPAGVIHVYPTTPLQNKHTIIGNVPDLDPFGKFPVHCPNGSKYSVKLGSSNLSAEADRLTYSLTVPATGAYSILFNYAIVLENPGHLPYQQPRFTAKAFDVTDSLYIDCPPLDFTSGTDLSGYSFKLSDVPAATSNSIYYKDWSTATIDLKNYHNKVIRLEFTINDCTFGGHFGYAYLDVEDNSISAPITGNAYCQGQNSVTLRGPDGFAGYTWYNADLSAQVGQGQSITINPAPPNLTGYELKLLPYPSLGCPDTLYTVVNKIDEGFKLSVADTVLGCKDTGADLTAAIVTAGSSAGTTFSYFRDPLATEYLYNPNAVDSTGVYYIKGVSNEGCTNILPVTVVLEAPVIKITDPSAVIYPATVDLTKTFVPGPGLTYEFYSDAKAVNKLIDYTTIKNSGTFYIKAIDQNGCSTVAPVNVIITLPPPPPYAIVAVNAFTPNGDEINDYFFLTATGPVTFISLTIFNRYGQLIFTAKSFSEYWNGRYNGKDLPAGTYYWVFDGGDSYNKVSIKKSGSIALIR